MVAKEYCCYTRPYSRIEGFQLAHTLYYSPARLQMGSRRAESLHDLWHLLVLRGQTWYIILN